jgi:hypothetical protein
MEGVVDGPAGQVSSDRHFHGLMVVVGAQWNEDKMPKDALTHDALGLGWKQTRLER